MCAVVFSSLSFHILIGRLEQNTLKNTLHGRFNALVSLLPTSSTMHVSVLDTECFGSGTESPSCYPHHISLLPEDLPYEGGFSIHTETL